MGIPVSGCASPWAMRESAARACSRLRSGSSVMKAFSSGLSLCARSRNNRVSSALEIRTGGQRPGEFGEGGVYHSLLDAGARGCEGPVADARRAARLLDYFRHQVEPRLDLRCDATETARAGRASDTVSSRSRKLTSWAWDIGSTPRVSADLHLLDQSEDARQLTEHLLSLGVRDGDAREQGDALDVVQGEGHWVDWMRKKFGPARVSLKSRRQHDDYLLQRRVHGTRPLSRPQLSAYYNFFEFYSRNLRDLRSKPKRELHVRIPWRLLLQRSRHRPRHRQHPDLRAGQGHRAERALGRRDPSGRRTQRQEDHPGGRAWRPSRCSAARQGTSSRSGR